LRGAFFAPGSIEALIDAPRTIGSGICPDVGESALGVVAWGLTVALEDVEEDVEMVEGAGPVL